MKIWRFSHKAKYARLRTLPSFAPYELRRTCRILVRIPRLLLRRALCHGGKRFCLLVGQFLVSSFGFTAFVTFAFFAAKNPTPSLTHSKLPNFPGHWRTRCKPNPPLSKIIRRYSRYSRRHLPAIRLKFNARYYTLFFFQRQISGTSIYDCAILLPSSSSIKIP